MRTSEGGRLELHGARFWLAHHVEFVSLRSTLEKTIGRAANGLVYQEGEKSGAGYVAMLDRQFAEELEGRSPRERLDFFLHWFSDIGYGRFEVEEFDEARCRAHVVLKESIEAESYGRASAVACFLIAGLLAYVVGAVSGRAAFCEETQCRAAGAFDCRFSVTPAE